MLVVYLVKGVLEFLERHLHGDADDLTTTYHPWIDERHFAIDVLISNASQVLEQMLARSAVLLVGRYFLSLLGLKQSTGLEREDGLPGAFVKVITGIVRCAAAKADVSHSRFSSTLTSQSPSAPQAGTCGRYLTPLTSLRTWSRSTLWCRQVQSQSMRQVIQVEFRSVSKRSPPVSSFRVHRRIRAQWLGFSALLVTQRQMYR